MNLTPLSAYDYFTARGAHRPVALLFTLGVWLAYLFLRLESPAWQALLAERQRLFPQFVGKRPTLGDPLRLLIQCLWLLLRRVPSPRNPGRLARGLTAVASRLRSVWQGIRRYRARLAETMMQVPARFRDSALQHDAAQRLRRLSVFGRRLFYTVLTLCAVALALLCVTEPFGYMAQLVFIFLLWGIAMLVRYMPGRFPTLMLIVLSTIISCRYLWWRYTSTLNWNDTLDLVCGVILLAAETYSWFVLILGYIQTCWPLQRKPASLPQNPGHWPTVDLMIPTYNEDLSVVRTTVLAALGLDWPRDRLRIYILDDGRRDAFRAFADEVGVGYIVRPDNKHAKAGNLNHALGVTESELIAIFDCDHVPVRSFLQMTVGWFLKDPKLALVQTPHHFFSPDPFERNLGSFRRRPNEGELFYGLIQDGNDMWNAAFFCGSCAVLRRTALESIGGFAVETVTEDAHTALRMHRQGWTSAYLSIPQAAGLATESLSAHIGQRIRWARGMVQIFRTDNPLFGRGLSLFQRVCYANAMLHFLAGLPRLIFLTAPLAFLLLHAYIIYAPAVMILLYVLPHMIHASLTNSRMQGKYRQTFWGEVYETVLAWYIARPTTVALFAPKKGKFNVTAKGGLMEQEQFDWRIAQPYLVLAALNVVGLGFAVWRLITGPAAEIGTVIVSSLWVIYNLLILGAACAVAAEVRQVRRAHRVQMHLPAALLLESGHGFPCTLVDYSDGGIGLQLGDGVTPAPGARVRLLLTRGQREFAFNARVTRIVGRHLGLTFDGLSLQQRIDLVHCTFARADAWLGWQDKHEVDRPLRSLGEVLKLGGIGYLRLVEHAPGWLSERLQPVRELARWLASYMPRTPQPLPSTNLVDRDA
ncbi:MULTISPECIES: UDP-forming cellulose synthase catalytic subunit [Pseudomonas]|uniref:Cellulose synthase catalytic subunit [UDP-forming] n=1 Tax=Pseudomonas taiwanensis TaxID=470150 RepID=A0ABR6VCT8_9PSED|nr:MULTISPECIES: UDP-forming cellulose synthase catalytic subunit [Pseudomonas]AGZ33004.1 cellulose synthase catalytic subunit [Pseudomonas sp. VLB120]AVD87626.1 UDP-forming cellulose synthase catalytic subunit [Pseudomonas sp. SWI44]MBC3478287.1 UDP-forming cellulose synthase catalytic subunit [Pseudomonas taiwanensis]MBC3492141.1 UDP-forming cellulose synthase catalytic subunit [Pseudomonas taiwanensis]MDT8926484.1 UDP-forming cellulose synthase catalytic subunit [Pseudomonas taiwanensis]